MKSLRVELAMNVSEVKPVGISSIILCGIAIWLQNVRPTHFTKHSNILKAKEHSRVSYYFLSPSPCATCKLLETIYGNITANAFTSLEHLPLP